MTEAQSYCREKYTDLVTIRSMKDVEDLNNVVDLSRMGSSGNRTWIGLHSSWTWSLSDRSFYAYGEDEFRQWWSGEPSNADLLEICTSMYDDGFWGDRPCDHSLHVICCDVTGTNVTFVRISMLLSWPEAQSYCREHHTDLASVRNMAENQRVKEMLGPGEEVWIGLFRGPWKWLDGSNSPFRYWSLSEPNNYYRNEMCVAANFGISGKWEDWPCDEKKASICYEQVTVVTKQVVRLSLKKSSSLDLNDPAVMEDILKQLRRRLKDKGLDENVRLSWRKQSDGKVFRKDDEKTRKCRKRKKDEF
ncbi:C-type mannose receptor 2-like [Pempheris klunzingeri]|uniref:C-type mannose receptor 2-like n=1 Tax=Pempheris klunzingeri TaxID=3127111 RepID=UPI0039802221